jgi:hypothetical protein
MSHQTGARETGETRRTAATEGGSQPLEVIACDGCGRRFATADGPGMIAAIKGPCPDCGGRFELLARPRRGSAPVAR